MQYNLSTTHLNEYADFNIRVSKEILLPQFLFWVVSERKKFQKVKYSRQFPNNCMTHAISSTHFVNLLPNNIWEPSLIFMEVSIPDSVAAIQDLLAHNDKFSDLYSS